MAATVLAIVIGAIELRGEVTQATIGEDAWRFSDVTPGDRFMLIIPEWDALPPFGDEIRDTEVSISIGDEKYRTVLNYTSSDTHAWRRLSSLGSYGGSMISLAPGGHWNVYYTDPWHYQNHYDIWGTLTSVSGIPEPDSSELWLTLIISWCIIWLQGSRGLASASKPASAR